MSKLIRNKSLKNLNTFGIECKAKHYYELNNEIEVFEFLTDIKSVAKPIYYLGGGANTLFTHNYKGSIVKMNIKGITLIKEDDNHYYVEANAGVVWIDFVDYCVANNYYGAENLVAIPGTVGAAPIQNIGAYGVEAKDIIHEVYYYDIAGFMLKKLDNKSCKFGYRNSIFKNELKDNILITKVVFKLSKQSDFKLTYGSISNELEKRGITEPNIKELADTISEIRSQKLPDITEIGNAGSFFKNPIVEIAFADNLRKEFPKLVSYPHTDGFVKLAAGWLIDNAGLKGYKIGGAAVHQNQALVIINKENATGEDIVKLSAYIQKEIKEIYNVDLFPEVIFI